MLLLYGSRARGESTATSDWDFGYLAGPAFDADALLATLVEHVGTDAVDLVDLSRASGQLRYRAAAEGRIVIEPHPGTFERFWNEAVSFWLDMGPVIRTEYEAALERLAR